MDIPVKLENHFDGDLAPAGSALAFWFDADPFAPASTPDSSTHEHTPAPDEHDADHNHDADHDANHDHDADAKLARGKKSRKRKSWGQQLPEPKTCLPPRCVTRCLLVVTLPLAHTASVTLPPQTASSHFTH